MEMPTVKLTLPYPPSANVYWRVRAYVSKQNKKPAALTYVSEEAKAYKEEVRLITRGYKPLTGDIHAVFRFYRPRMVGDLSNRIKVLEDALQGRIYVDDAQITKIIAERYEGKANPRVEVEITEITSAPALFAEEIDDIPY